VCNVASAIVMYRVGHRHGRTFFSAGWGRHVLNPHQMKRMVGFYDRFGTAAVFLTRFLPGLRSVVPVFAGVTHQPLLPVAIPLALASAIWYGALVWAGAYAGRNLDAVLALLGRVNGWLLGVALLVFGAVLVWWWRTRHHGRHE
jgi:membrane protein DedA with SNARE-associated domain